MNALYVVCIDQRGNLAIAKKGDQVFRAVEVAGSFYNKQIYEFEERDDYDPEVLLAGAGQSTGHGGGC